MLSELLALLLQQLLVGMQIFLCYIAAGSTSPFAAVRRMLLPPCGRLRSRRHPRQRQHRDAVLRLQREADDIPHAIWPRSLQTRQAHG